VLFGFLERCRIGVLRAVLGHHEEPKTAVKTDFDMFDILGGKW
jgi:hypothetical protein